MGRDLTFINKNGYCRKNNESPNIKSKLINTGEIMHQQRIDKLLNLLDKDECDLIAINAGHTLAYLTGLHFHLSERPTVLLIARGKTPAIIYPELEETKVKNAPVALAQFAYSEDISQWGEAFTKAIDYTAKKEIKIGLEPTAARFLEIDLLQNVSNRITFQSAARVLEPLRMTKDENEVKNIREAISIAQIALEMTLPSIKVGVTEKAIANQLVINLLKSGSDPDLPFSPIVATGPNSANPHSVPGDRQLKDGDFIVIDFGARSNGYISDITRTFALGNADEKMKHIYETVKFANETARSISSAHLISKNVDAAARDIIKSAGYGDYFTHRTGHGIGLEAHEEPYISSKNSMELTPGMTFTIEPGIYLPDKAGVRIEDNVLVINSGLETLTSFDRNLRIL
jgi:Xaa-Pro dipeptidase